MKDYTKLCSNRKDYPYRYYVTKRMGGVWEAILDDTEVFKWPEEDCRLESGVYIIRASNEKQAIRIAKSLEAKRTPPMFPKKKPEPENKPFYEPEPENMQPWEDEFLNALFGQDEPEPEPVEEEENSEPAPLKAVGAEFARSPICMQIRRWLANTPFAEFAEAICKRVRGQENTKLIALNVYNYLECVVQGRRHNSNLLLTAPSGCGKTETYRAIREYFKVKVPKLIVYQVDMTSVTEEGYRGKDAEYLVEPLLAAKDSYGIGIAFLDEFDKKIVPSYAYGGMNLNAAVQAQILTMLEGRVVSGSDEDYTPIDTANTLFIGLGSFDACRVKKAEKARSTIGFGGGCAKDTDHYDEITREDIIELGASYEIVGRIPLILSYHRLDEETLDLVIDDMLAREGETWDCKVTVSKEMRALLHEEANGAYGCRTLANRIHDKLMPTYLELRIAGVDLQSYTIELGKPNNIRRQCEPKGAVGKRRLL